jgi:hypothetical protein
MKFFTFKEKKNNQIKQEKPTLNSKTVDMRMLHNSLGSQIHFDKSKHHNREGGPDDVESERNVTKEGRNEI